LHPKSTQVSGATVAVFTTNEAAWRYVDRHSDDYEADTAVNRDRKRLA